MKTLILNYKKWRCGESGGKNISHGKGDTNLLNREGYMCCLGQFSPQLNSKVKMADMLDQSAPCNVLEPISGLSTKTPYNTNTELSNKAMGINDDQVIPIEEKIFKLKALFKSKGYRIRVTNLPKTLAKKLRNKK